MSTLEGYQLSPVQRRVWASAESGEPGTVSARVGLNAPLDPDRLHAALAALAERHEALRLSFVQYPELRVPMQKVAPAGPAAVAAFVSAGDVAVSSARPFAVTAGDTELVLTASRLVADPASVGLLLRELATLYGGAVLPADDDRPQFIDLALWQLEQAGPQVAAAAEHPAPGGELVVEVDAAVLSAVRAAARSAGCPLEPVLLAAWASVVARRLDAADELLIDRYDDGRAVPGTESMVGPLGCHRPLSLALPLPETAARTLAVVADALGGTGTEPDGPVAAGFTLLDVPVVDDLAALSARELRVDAPPPSGDPHLTCVLEPQRLTMRLTFGAAGPDAADRAARLLDAVVATLAGLPGALSGGGPLDRLGAAEEARLLAWSGDAAVPETGETLTALLDAGLRLDPAATAVSAPDGTVTFAQLDAAAGAVADRLADLGVATEDRVVVLAGRSWHTIAAFVGILRAGAVYVPVDPDQPHERLVELAHAVTARLVLAGDDERAGWERSGFATAPIWSPGPASAAPGTRRPEIDPGQAAYVIFTSGTTAVPRPVVVEHRSVAHLYRALAGRVYPAGRRPLRVAVNAPFTFDASVKQIVQLAAGHTLCLLSEDLRRAAGELLDHLAGQRVDVFDCTPTHLRVLLFARRAGQPLPGTLLVGGEAVDADLWRELAALDGVRTVNLYGPTECTVDVSAAEVTAGTTPSIGRPLPGTRLWVMDARLRPVPIGAAGELCVSGPQIARGYLGDDAATAQRFTEATVPGGATVRLYRTGDRVRFAEDGRLEYRGRLDDQLKLSGHRIEPAEVAAVLRRHPGVAQAVVTARPDRDGTPRLVGYVVPAAPDAAGPDLDAIEGINLHETRYLRDEIFVQRTYLRGGVTLPESAVVFDVGANIGMFALFARSVCPTARVYAFEPTAAAFDKLRANLAGQAELFPYGLSDRERDETFAVYPGYSMMSGQYDYADPGAEIRVVRQFLANERDSGLEGRDELLGSLGEVLEDRFRAVPEQCRLRRLSDVVDEQGVQRIDLLKIDVQRAELDVLRGLDERHWPIVRQVAMEVHDAPGTPTAGRLAAITELLRGYGFQVHAEQDAMLHGTDRHALYAVRPSAAGPRPAAEPAPAADGPALRDWLGDRVPGYLVPSAIVVLDALPRTAHGKVDLAALPEPAGPARPDPVDTAVAGPVEQVLLEVWREVLGADDVSVLDNFFQRGGDSIRAIRMRAAAERRGVSFSLRSIFRHHTIRELAAECSLAADAVPAADAGDAFRMIGADDRARLPAGLADAYPASALQLGMLYHSALSPGRTAYHVVVPYHVPLPFDRARFRAATDATTATHPVLRTSFDLGTFAQPLQLVHRAATVPLTVTDLRAADPVELRDRVAGAIEAERAHPFTPSDVPLMRLHVLITAADAFELVLSMHHAVMDGWSQHLMLDELVRRFQGLYPTGTEPALPFRRFVELEREALADDAARLFWRSRLSGVEPLLLGGDGPPRLTAEHTEAFPAELSAKLRKLAADRAVPVKSLLLAAHLRVQGEFAGRDDVVTGLVVGARPSEAGGDRTVGLFLNTLPVRLALGTDPLTRLAERAWAAEQEMMGHHLVPTEGVERAVGRGRLSDVYFNYTHFHDLDGSVRKVERRSTGDGVPIDVSFGLTVDVSVDPETLELLTCLQYDGTQLGPEQVTAMAARFRRLLEDAVAGPVALPTIARPWTATGWPDLVAELWRDLTGKAPAGADTDFFAAGGTSLTALRLVSVLHARHGADVGLREFRAAPTFGALVGRAEVAAVVAEEWCASLELTAPVPDVDFFELGGNSLTGLAMAQRIEQRLGTPFPIDVLFLGGTLSTVVAACRYRP